MNPRAKQTGFTLLELAAVVMGIAILAALFLNRVQRYQELAEKTVLQATVANLRSALRLRVADLMMHGRMNELNNLSRENPMSWMMIPPSNYLGLRAQPQGLPAGSWYFDQDRRELVYLLDRSRYFKPGPDGQKAIRYRVVLLTRKPGPNDGVQVEGLRLNPVTPYAWSVF